MKKSNATKTVIYLFFFIYCLLALIPILLILAISFSPEKNIILNGYKLLPSSFSLDSYRYILTGNATVTNAYLVTLAITFSGTFFHLLISSMFAYPLAQGKLKYEKFFSIYILICLLFSGGLVPTYILLSKILHLRNTITVLFFPFLASSINLLIMKRFFSTIPHSLIESAKIDGANDYYVFFKIIIPLSTPILATIGLFVSVFLWNEWITCSLYIEDSKKFVLQFLLQSIMNNIEYLQANPNNTLESISKLPSESARMATCVLALGPIVLAYPYLQKYFVKGLTLGAIKT